MPGCCQSEPGGGCSNGKHRFYHGAAYHATPSAPTLEININQHNPSPCHASPSCPSASSLGYSPTPMPSALPPSRPSQSPPAPPHPSPIFNNGKLKNKGSNSEYANPHYQLTPATSPIPNKRSPPQNDRRESWRQLGRNASMRAVKASTALRQRLYERKNGVMFRVCLAELILAALLLALGILCACKTREFCPYYSAIWTAAVFLANALVGLVAAKMDTADFYVAHLVLSLASFALSAIGAVLSAINWHLIGTYRPAKMGRGRQLMHPKADEEQMYRAFCLLGEHDAMRISYIYSHMDEYDFRACLEGIKIGIAVNSLQFLLTIILGLLFLVSTIICLLRTCTTCHGNGNGRTMNNRKK